MYFGNPETTYRNSRFISMSIMSDAPTTPNGGKWELTYCLDLRHQFPFATVRWCRCVRHDRRWFICQSFMRIFLIGRGAQKWFEFYLYHNYVLGLNWSRSGQPNLIEDQYCREKIQTFWTSPIFFPIYKSYKFYLHKAPYFRVFCVQINLDGYFFIPSFN